jgi:hypothetical protein
MDKKKKNTDKPPIQTEWIILENKKQHRQSINTILASEKLKIYNVTKKKHNI